jgi:hypothetical protein
MRRTLLGLIIALGGSVGLLAQQPLFDGGRGQFPGCPGCGVYSYVDSPTPEQTVSASNFVIEGWGFECVSGLVADRVDLSYQDYDGYWRPLLQPAYTLNYGSIPRPDVWMAYRPACPGVPANSGWHLLVTNPPPVGLRRVLITVWHGPYYEKHWRTYLVRP